MRLLYVSNDGEVFLDEQHCRKHEAVILQLLKRQTEAELEALERRCVLLAKKIDSELDDFLQRHPEVNADDVVNRIIARLELPTKDVANESQETENPGNNSENEKKYYLGY